MTVAAIAMQGAGRVSQVSKTISQCDAIRDGVISYRKETHAINELRRQPKAESERRRSAASPQEARRGPHSDMPPAAVFSPCATRHPRRGKKFPHVDNRVRNFNRRRHRGSI